jgi:hypothetical protein
MTKTLLGTVAPRKSMSLAIFLGILVVATITNAGFRKSGQSGDGSASGAARANQLHQDFDRLLSLHVEAGGVRYEAWAASTDDMEALTSYIRGLASLNPEGWPQADGLAFWINLYNAVTLKLVLDHHPIDSIKDTAGFMKSPWKKKLVTVAGRKLSLDEIENDIIRPVFGDARIHFALNCAAVSCPQLSEDAFLGARLDEQLDTVTRRAINDERWVRVEQDEVHLTKIFSWYEDDFKESAGSIREFVRRYRDATLAPLPKGEFDIEDMDYDWKLNHAEG